MPGFAPGTDPREYPETAWAGIAAGAPLICAISPCIPNGSRLRENGPAPALRVPGNDPQSLARAAISLMRDERLRARLVHSGGHPAGKSASRPWRRKRWAL